VNACGVVELTSTQFPDSVPWITSSIIRIRFL
jgi:hypothetical protein